VNSATSALHLACLALGVGPGDLVWTSPITFVASANCARYCGADVDFVDIDPVTYNLSVAALAEKLAAAKRAGRLPKLVIPVHLAGAPCDMAEIRELSRSYGFRVVEDASHAVGARYQNEPVGRCTYSDVAVFSFHPVKIVTTGEGGLALTNDPNIARRMALLRSHGITREPGEMTEPSHGGWYYEQIALGFNYRMTDLQAALGRSQLKHLDAWVTARHRIADRYDRALQGLPLMTPVRPRQAVSAFHLYIVLVTDGGAERRLRAFDHLRANGVGVNVHYIPVHLQPDYRRLGFERGAFPVAERYYERALSLPMFPALADAQQDRVVRLLTEALR
jgi:UDP-4-amino-4,6-dideoxy-N-acetyl-beta-L-altrosamine transaminase